MNSSLSKEKSLDNTQLKSVVFLVFTLVVLSHWPVSPWCSGQPPSAGQRSHFPLVPYTRAHSWFSGIYNRKTIIVWLMCSIKVCLMPFWTKTTHLLLLGGALNKHRWFQYISNSFNKPILDTSVIDLQHQQWKCSSSRCLVPRKQQNNQGLQSNILLSTNRSCGLRGS